MKTKEDYFYKYKESAGDNDVVQIDENLNSMMRGKVKAVWKDVEALYRMIKDPHAAKSSKAMAIATLVYLISPVDAVPDVIPALGLTDDVAIIATTVTTLAVELKKYKLDYEKARAEIEKDTLIEVAIAEEQARKEKELELLKVKQSFILKCIGLIGGFTVLLMWLLK